MMFDIGISHNAAFGRRLCICVLWFFTSGLAAQVSPNNTASVCGATLVSTIVESADSNLVAIGTIQGTKSQSERIGETLSIRAIVTRVVPNNGFYLQEPAGRSDQDAKTSDALWVQAKLAELPDVGDRLLVTGTVQELRAVNRASDSVVDTQTALTSAEWVTCATQQKIPVIIAPRRIEAEAFEHMQIDLKGWQVTGRDRELIRVANERLFFPTQIVAPGRAAQQLQKRNIEKSIFIRQTDQLNLRAGDFIRVQGIVVANAEKPLLDYHQPPKVTRATAGPEAPKRKSFNTQSIDVSQNSQDDIRVVSMNIENLFNGDGNKGGFPTSRGAASMEEYAKQLKRITVAVDALQADVLAVMELENDGYKTTSTIAQLSAALNHSNDERDWQFIDPGLPRLGDDVIAVGLLFDAKKLQPVGSAQTLNKQPFNGLSRVPLAQHFARLGEEKGFWLAVNHFKSKGGCSRASGRNADQNDFQSCWNDARVQSALLLSDWLYDLQQSSQISAAMLVGDINSYRMEDPIRTFIRADWIDVVSHYRSPPIYSYRYQGAMGYAGLCVCNERLAGSNSRCRYLEYQQRCY